MKPQIQFLFSFLMSRNKPMIYIKWCKIPIIIFLLGAMLHSHLSYAQVVYDNNSVKVETAGPLSFTVPAGTDRLLVVCVGAFSTGGSGTAAATFNGQSMGKAITSEDSYDVSHATSIIFYLALADGAAITSNVTISGISSVGFIGATSYTGVDQTTPLGNTAQDIGDNNVNATSHTLSPTTNSNDLLVHFLTTASAVNASLGGDATAFSGFSLGPPNQIVGGYKIATATSHNLTTNFESPFGVWAHVAAEFNQVAAPSNTDPSITVNNLNYTEDQNSGNPVQIDGSATASDTDGDSDWDTGASLTVQITANNEATDEISISQTGLTLSGTNVQDGGTTFATISESSGTANDGIVTDNATLTINFTSNATNARVQTLVRAIAYRTTSNTPSTSTRTVTYTLTDKNSASTTETATISVTANADEPTVTSPATATTVDQASFNIAGTAEANALVRVYSDADNSGTINGADAVVAMLQLTGGATAFTIATNLTQNAANNFLVTAFNGSDESDPVDVPTITEDSTAPEILIENNANDQDILDGSTTINTTLGTDYGSLCHAGTANSSNTYKVSNTGDGDLTFGGTALTISNTTDFSISTGITNSSTLAASNNITFTIQFDPQSAGTKTCTVTVNSDDADEAVYNFEIQGVGLNPTVTVAATTSTVTEDGATNLVYRFTRDCTSGTLPVNFSIEGTAQDSDYVVSSTATFTYNQGTNTGSITFPAGDSTVDLTVNPTTDSLIEGSETVVVKIENP